MVSVPQYLHEPHDHEMAASSALGNSQVSWQSAFWALAALTLNSMAQERGKPFGVIPKKYNPLLRAAPFLCSVDIITIICDIYYASRDVPLRTAVALVADYRENTPRPAEGETGISRFVKIVIWLTSLSQYVKIMAFHGLGSLQVLSTLLFVSSVLESLLSWSAQSAPARAGPEAERLKRDLETMDKILGQHFSIWVTLALQMLFHMFMFVFMPDFLLKTVVPVLCNMVAWTLFEFAWWEDDRPSHRRACLDRMLWSAAFLCLDNLMYTALYFAMVYDPAGTYKPAWTNYLG